MPHGTRLWTGLTIASAALGTRELINLRYARGFPCMKRTGVSAGAREASIESSPLDSELVLFGFRFVAPSDSDGAIHGARIRRGKREQATRVSPRIVQEFVGSAGARVADQSVVVCQHQITQTGLIRERPGKVLSAIFLRL